MERTFRDLLLGQHASLHAGLDPAVFSKQAAVLRGLDEAQLRGRPGAGLNTTAWLLWHMARIEDVAASLIADDGAQTLDADWCARLGTDRREIGTGMTAAEVDDLSARIDLDALLAYRAAVGTRTRALIAGVSPGTLGEIVGAARVARAGDAGAFGPRAGWVAEAWATRPREFLLTYTIIGHSFLHFGELDVIRGLFGVENR